MTEALDVFGDVHDLLEVLVLSVVENGIVDYDAVDIIVRIGGQERIFDLVTVNLAQAIPESTARNPWC